MVERRRIWKVLKKEEGRSRESVDIVTRNADTKERTVHFGRKQTRELEMEEMAIHADTTMGSDMTRTRARSYILTMHQGGIKISLRKIKIRELMSRSC